MAPARYDGILFEYYLVYYVYFFLSFCLFFKTVRVAVFAEGPAADEARAAGADVVGGDELIEEIRKGTLIPSVAVPYRSLSIYMHVFLCTVCHVFEDVHELERLLFFFSYHSTFL